MDDKRFLRRWYVIPADPREMNVFRANFLKALSEKKVGNGLKTPEQSLLEMRIEDQPICKECGQPRYTFSLGPDDKFGTQNSCDCYV